MMKKRITKYVIGMLLICTGVLLVYVLCFNVNPISLATENISEIRQHYFVGNDDLNHVCVSTGTRENPYLLDGIHNEMTDFGIVVLKTTLLGITEPSCTLTLNGTDYTGVMERNPYDNTYVMDIGQFIPSDATLLVKIQIQSTEYTYTPTIISNEWEITAEKAMEIGFDNLEQVIKNLISGRQFLGECYVKIVSDPSNQLGMYYWYVSVMDRQGNSHAVVIDSTNGEILSCS